VVLGIETIYDAVIYYAKEVCVVSKKEKEYLATAASSVAGAVAVWVVLTFLLMLLLG
jgi:hypothetical protein